MNSKQKDGRYSRILEQFKDLITKTGDPIARMATASALLHHKFDYFFWTGFYRIVDGELTVGPYQGSLACQVLTKDTGVCWAGVNKEETIIVPDVHAFPGHIACDSRSKSEIVIPVFKQSENGTKTVVAILDVDSSDLESFDEIDAKGLESIAALIYPS